MAHLRVPAEIGAASSLLTSVADPGCFISDPDTAIFSSKSQDPNIFHQASRILHEKWNENLLFSCFFCFQE
jgi:hypothetical protein